jgi:hypothetical protein
MGDKPFSLGTSNERERALIGKATSQVCDCPCRRSRLDTAQRA